MKENTKESIKEDINFNGNPLIPPQNIEAEEAILGGILLDPEAIGRVIDRLKPEMFYTFAHSIIYRYAVSLHNVGMPTDLLSITSCLNDNDDLMRIGGRNKLTALMNATVSAVNIDVLAELVIEKYDRRQLIKAGNQLIELAHKTEDCIEEVKSKAEKVVYESTQSNRKSQFFRIGDIAYSSYNETVAIANGTKLPGVPYGFYDLDLITHGLHKGNLIYVAGRPAMGKTSFAMNIASHVGSNLKLPVAIFSYEMSKEELTQRFISVDARIPLAKIISGRLTSEEWNRYAIAVNKMNVEYKIFIDDNTSNTVNSIHSACRNLSSQQGELGLIVIDYIQLMSEPGFKAGERQLELSYISRKFKVMAGELNCPVLVLSQLNRGVESRADKRPMMSDLRDSGSLEQDANLVMMLYRDEYYNSKSADKGIAEVIIAKHRNGATGTIKLLFDGEYTQFKNLAQQTW